MCLLVTSVVCYLGYFKRYRVLVVSGLVGFDMQLGEVCKGFGGSVFDDQYGGRLRW